MAFVLTVVITGLILYTTQNKTDRLQTDVLDKIEPTINHQPEYTGEGETMLLTFFVQDKEAALTSDCGVTKKIQKEVNKTLAVADTSLKILFEEELAAYGDYQTLNIRDQVAEVVIDMPGTSTISSLSSCEARHLNAVIQDTLTQYPSIKNIEFHSPDGLMEY